MITDYSENKTEELYNECCDDNCEPDEYDCIAAGIYERQRELREIADTLERFADYMKRVISGEYVIETDYDEEDESGDDWYEEEDGDDDWDEDDDDEDDDDWDEDEDEDEDNDDLDKDDEDEDDDWDEDDDDVWWRSGSKTDSGEFTFYDDGDDMYDYDGEFLDYQQA